ncbi:HEAT repeat domain-containing protein [Mesorhizobium sp. WSM3859]|uniref:HEAT repeat domain-containing protein n=1 Tax=Mesorhizobium sp. WSM3859 TaxID=2029402 RepID=UPI000BB00A40|nr:hypothetical protein CK230_24325 [Mesorhizobium sp. WSM3859]
MASARARIVPDVLREHAALAAFQWAQRDNLAAADPPATDVVAGIDIRLESNLDALRIAGGDAWAFAIEQWIAYPEKGELFVIGFLALEFRDADFIEQAVDFARNHPDADSGLIGAFRWLPPAPNAALVRSWLAGIEPTRCGLAIAILTEYRVDPGHRLARLIDHDSAYVRAQACRLAGTLGRRDLADRIRGRLDDASEAVRFWSGWAGVKLGFGVEAAEHLKPAAVKGSLEALRAVVEAGPETSVRAWLGGLFEVEATRAIAVRGAGMLGDRSVLTWLIRQMSVPALAPAAGAAFLQLFPEAAKEEGLFVADLDVLGEAFQQDDAPSGELPVAARIKHWADQRGMLPRKTIRAAAR